MSPPRPQDWTVLGLGLGTFFAVCITVSILDTPLKDLKKQYWIVSLIYNLISYSAIFLPGFVILKYVSKTQFLETGPKLLSPAIRLCFYGNNEDQSIDDSVSGRVSLFQGIMARYPHSMIFLVLDLTKTSYDSNTP